jgi:hypothetical protein
LIPASFTATMPIERIIELERFDNWTLLVVKNHKITIAFANVDPHVKGFHRQASCFS